MGLLIYCSDPFINNNGPLVPPPNEIEQVTFKDAFDEAGQVYVESTDAAAEGEIANTVSTLAAASEPIVPATGSVLPGISSTAEFSVGTVATGALAIASAIGITL